MSKDYIPHLKTRKDINEEAKKVIDSERSGKQLGLLCRFKGLNIALGKYFRFKQVTTIAGLSGHGKSTLLNMILADFLDKTFNFLFKPPVIIIHNTFEMLPVDEVIRNVGSKTGRSHFNLLSSEFTNGQYNTISDEEFSSISKVLDDDDDRDHYYFDEPTNTQGLIKNVNAGIAYYQEKYNTNVIPHVVVAIDHSLLVDGEKGETVIDTITRLSKLAVLMKKKGYMVFIVGQLNGNIEATERLKNANVHYPIKSDIYAQAQIYNASDNVLIIHQPELLGIQEYGVRKLVTTGLIHLYVIKQRFGKIGSIWLKNELNKGKLIQFEPISNLPESKRAS